MNIYKWTRNSLLKMNSEGYKIISCKDEEDLFQVKTILKENKRCAQAGYILDDNNDKKYFILTKVKESK